jgi:hypothetical protein
MAMVMCRLWMVALLLAAGCDQSRSKAPDSLVGAKHLPPVSELSHETIQINHWGGARRDHLLTYELRPDNTLTVTHSLRAPGGDKTLGREAFGLAADAASQVRLTLSRLRPETLRGVEYVSYPVGCQPPIDSGDEVAIAFIDEHEKIGIFDLPYPCRDSKAAAARNAIAAVMQSLPTSKVAAAFSRLG